jgi:plasmid stabilization system protein ParE
VSLRFAPGAAAEFGDYLENVGRERGEDVALRESRRVLGELIRIANLSITGRRVQIEGESAAVLRWVVPPFVDYYTRNAEFVVLRLFHARRQPIER